MNARTRFILAVVMLGLLMTGPFLLTVGILWADLGPRNAPASWSPWTAGCRSAA
jgi:hypothetical protein